MRAFLAGSPFQPELVYDAGEPMAAGDPAGPSRKSSGFDLAVSPGQASELQGLIDEAILFLDEHEDELRRLGRFEGVEAVSLEFETPWASAAAQTDTFPPDLLWRAGALDIALRVTHYPSVEE